MGPGRSDIRAASISGKVNVNQQYVGTSEANGMGSAVCLQNAEVDSWVKLAQFQVGEPLFGVFYFILSTKNQPHSKEI